jgi:uncharacterized protein with von Willebrand factor type A (vWA) domain
MPKSQYLGELRMTNFAQAVKNESNFTLTENLAVALKSTGNPLLDLFSQVGAIRAKDYEEVSKMFQDAFSEDKLLSTKLIFFARNVRGGLGERETSRKMLRSLALSNPDIVKKNIDLIPFFGRYDDLYCLIDTPVENAMWTLLTWTIKEDLMNMEKGRPVTLCSKWLKSTNTSSKESVALGKLTVKQFGMTEKQYRKTLSKLREYIKVIERTMSAQDWTDIAYAQVPSHAMKNYRKAFSRHDGTRFGEYIENVKKGDEKIHSGTLYPYDILEAAKLTYRNRFSIEEDAVLEAQWKALPNYIKKQANILVLADTSGSMEGRPMSIALGLAVYFAERNIGPYKNLFLTFSESPRYVILSGNTLKEKLSHIESIVANTDLEKAMDLILKTAIENNVSQEEMPLALVILSDMHFDGTSNIISDGGWYAGYGNRAPQKITFHESMKTKFSRAGYTMPKIVYWNVDERSPAVQARQSDEGVILVSGASTSTFKSIISNISTNPYDYMLEVLNDEMYNMVQI